MRACLGVLGQRDRQLRLRWNTAIFDHAIQVLISHGAMAVSEHAVHGSLCVLVELLMAKLDVLDEVRLEQAFEAAWRLRGPGQLRRACGGWTARETSRCADHAGDQPALALAFCRRCRHQPCRWVPITGTGRFHRSVGCPVPAARQAQGVRGGKLFVVSVVHVVEIEERHA